MTDVRASGGGLKARFLPALLLLFSCIVGVALAEGVARVTSVAALSLTDPLFQRSDAKGLSYEFKPHARGHIWGQTWVETNAYGLRGPEITAEKPAGVVRIGVFGDSASFGQGVTDQESYPRVLERLLNEPPAAGGSRFEVLNFAVPAYNITNIVSSFTEKGMRFSLDLAVIAPILEDYGFHRNHTADDYGYPVHASSPIKPGPLKNALRRVHLAYVVRDAYWAATGMAKEEVRVVYGGAAEDELQRRTWERAEEELGRFVTRARTAAVKPLYLSLGMGMPVGLTRVIEGVGIPLVDLRPVVSNYSAESLQVSHRDAHPSALYHRLIATELAKTVRGILTQS